MMVAEGFLDSLVVELGVYNGDRGVVISCQERGEGDMASGRSLIRRKSLTKVREGT